MQGLSLVSIGSCLFRCYACRAWAFFALADYVINCLTFAQTRIAGGLDFRVMNEQVRTAVVGYDKPKTLLIVEPFYFT